MTMEQPDSMVERVARGLHAAADARMKGRFRVDWVDCLPEYRKLMLADARAAIEAMEEPTAAMVEAGQAASPPFGDHKPYEAWQAMISAALSEPLP